MRDLHGLLQRAQLSPPYILVGHSYGGMNVKLFAETFPSEVIGMVLIEPSHEDVGKRLFALDPESHKKNLQYLEDLKGCLPATSTQLAIDPKLTSLCVGHAGPRYSDAINAAELALAVRPPKISAWVSEMTHIWAESADQVRTAHRTLGSTPIVLLTKPPSPPAPNETTALREQKNEILSRLDDQTVGMSSRGRRITVEDTGHYIQLDQPSVVISAIQSTISDSSAPPADAL